jgi:1-acyl-sn-glycerol-3-phosphate acyltransferase
VDRDALRAAFEVLKEGGVLAVAPEGTRSRVGSMQQAKPGLAYLATRANAAIVPMGFWGIEQLRDWKHLRRPNCRLVIGKPFCFPTSTERVSTDRLQELTDLAMIKIGLLIPSQYRGVYAERIAAVAEGRSHELDELIEVDPQQWGKG